MPGLGFVGSAYLPYNDEFDDSATLASLWTATTGGGGAGGGNADIDTTTPGHLHDGSGASPSIVGGGVWQPAPATPFTAIAKCTAISWNAGPGVGNSSIGIAQANPGPYYFVGVDVGSPGFMQVGSSKFDAAGAFVTNPHVVDTIAGSGYVIPHLVKLVVHSATNVDAYVSFDDGLTWHTICTGYNFGVTPNYIGILNGGSKADWDWFRLTQP